MAACIPRKMAKCKNNCKRIRQLKRYENKTNNKKRAISKLLCWKIMLVELLLKKDKQRKIFKFPACLNLPNVLNNFANFKRKIFSFLMTF